MSYLFLIVFVGTTVFYAVKYFRQKAAINKLTESLISRTSILNYAEEFRGGCDDWKPLVEELNSLIADISRLERQNTGRLNQIEATLGNLQEGVIIVDRDNYILLYNKFLSDIFPSVRKGVGKRVESCLSSSLFLEYLAEVKTGNSQLCREVSFMDNGKQLWMEMSAAELADVEEGNAPWYLFVFYDITRIKRLEQVRKDFVSNASHELKTPVAVIKAYAETLISDYQTMSGKDRGRFLNTIFRHSERLALLINDLLSLSRLEEEAIGLQLTESDFFSWVNEVTKDYQLQLEGLDRAFDLKLPSEHEVFVCFDALKIRQVLDNLVENACKYSPSESGIELGASVDGSELKVWVRDYGHGVPEADLKRIFERFYRVDKGRARETGGTGLGLSIVKHIVDCHHGLLKAENAEGGGLCVSFTLPLVKVPISIA